jgi:Ca2+-binding EF-hand superfamily protein
LIRAKKIEDKIELILKLMDENENGLLSYNEIVNRCNVMLVGMLESDNTELSLEKISDYITRQIFSAVNVPVDDEIPIEKIRELIESNSQES